MGRAVGERTHAAWEILSPARSRPATDADHPAGALAGMEAERRVSAWSSAAASAIPMA